MSEIQAGQRMSPQEAMKLAIAEAKKGAGSVAPNPLVGCVILDKDSGFLSSGYHAKVGGKHAEIEALDKISDRSALKGAHLYVTLEPCAHQGRTPPCAKTLAEIPFRSVTYGILDPNPKVEGRGLEILRQAGIEIRNLPEMEEELENLAEVFLHNMRYQRPFVALKVATSLDGQMALQTGESQWITGEKARIHSHFLRATHDAVLVGSRTFRTDNPSLNVRHPSYPNHPNKVILLDTLGDLIGSVPGSKVWDTHRPEDIFIVVSREAYSRQSQGLNVITCPVEESGFFEIDHFLKELYQHGISSVLVEGGAFTLGSFLNAQAAQRLHVFISPSIIGAEKGLSWTYGFGIERLKERKMLKRLYIENIGSDVYITGRFL